MNRSFFQIIVAGGFMVAEFDARSAFEIEDKATRAQFYKLNKSMAKRLEAGEEVVTVWSRNGQAYAKIINVTKSVKNAQRERVMAYLKRRIVRMVERRESLDYIRSAYPKTLAAVQG
jgi:hypothetical protein